MTAVAPSPATPAAAYRIHPDTLGRPAPAIARNRSPLSASHTSGSRAAAPASPPTPPRSYSQPSSRDRTPPSPSTPAFEHSARRKPVPSLLAVDLPATTSLPAAHPFAASSKASIKSARSASAAPSIRSSGASSPVTPGLARVEDDLFFVAPRRGTPPPPPRRVTPKERLIERFDEFELVESIPIKDDERDDRPERPSTFHGALDDAVAPVPEAAVQAGMLDACANAAIPTPDGSAVVAPDSAIAEPSHARRHSHARSVSVDRPLPTLPSDARSISTTTTGPGLVTPSTAPVFAFGDDVSVVSHNAGKPASKPAKLAKVPRKSLLHPPEPREDEEFSVDRVPSRRRLWEAGTMFLRDEHGKLVCFGDLFPRWDDAAAGAAERNPLEPPRKPRTVAFFIRHFWCGQCQDYMFASVSQLDPAALEAAGIRVVIISNGSWKIIKKYRQLFQCPFPIYVDGPRRLYQLLGMIKMTNDFGPMFKGRAAYHQRPVPTQLLHGLGNAFFRMPLADPGKLTQLGGEFVFGPGFECEFAHRMTTTSAPDVLRVAGCEHPTRNEARQIELEESQRAELARLEAEMETWRAGRETEIDRIRRKKAARRGIEYVPPSRSLSGIYGATGLDEELNEGWEVEGDGHGYGDGDDAAAASPGFAETHATHLRLPGGNAAPLAKAASRGASVDEDEYDVVEVDVAEMDRRFERVMALERERERARLAGERQHGAGGLEVEVEP
ncbi:hypothetical protein Q5752_006650 [Cryptotrichosporon argae]